jgi:hypothetical protein
MSAAAKRHMGRVAENCCVLCKRLGYGRTPAEVHHARTGVGAGQRNSDWLTMGLCPEHHRGASGVHGLGVRAFERTYGVTELELVAETLEQIYGGVI